MLEDDGSVTTKDVMRANALRDWSVIDETLALDLEITGIDVNASCDVAMVRTAQRWERVMRRPDNSGRDVILTTQGHERTWRTTNDGWRNYEILELGGEIFVNGESFTP